MRIVTGRQLLTACVRYICRTVKSTAYFNFSFDFQIFDGQTLGKEKSRKQSQIEPNVRVVGRRALSEKEHPKLAQLARGPAFSKRTHARRKTKIEILKLHLTACGIPTSA